MKTKMLICLWFASWAQATIILDGEYRAPEGTIARPFYCWAAPQDEPVSLYSSTTFIWTDNFAQLVVNYTTEHWRAVVDLDGIFYWYLKPEVDVAVQQVLEFDWPLQNTYTLTLQLTVLPEDPDVLDRSVELFVSGFEVPEPTSSLLWGLLTVAVAIRKNRYC